MNEYTKSYYEAFVNAPPPYLGNIRYEYTCKVSHVEGYKKFKREPIHVIPNVMDNEIFLPITQSILLPTIMPGRYYVSNFGRIYDACICKYLPGTDNGNGYLNVKLSCVKNNDSVFTKTIYIHQLVNFYFNFHTISTLVNYTCNHKDSDRKNNNSDNLEWLTQSENNYHRIVAEHKKISGARDMSNEEEIRQIRSISRGSISAETAKKICELLSQGYSVNFISATLKVHTSTVSEIKYRKTWTWVSKDYDFTNYMSFKIDKLTLCKICKMISDGVGVLEIQRKTGIDKAVISAIKHNGLFPEIRKMYGIYHESDDL